ncbi:mitochondrial inner membrane protein required for protein import [Myotisia sp. PD_48]|nr:mitochondrial inner membrane protein required for protein import [Myotisia sp. PD_48]
MLARAILPLVRQRTVPAGTRLALSHPSLRFYSQDSKKPSKSSGYSIPSSAPSSNVQSDPSHKPRVVVPPSSGAKKPESDRYSEEQTEFETSPDSKNNTAPNQQSAASNEQEASTDGPASATNAKNEPEEFPSDQPLPDLTQGIPSTLAAEMEARSKRRGTALNLTEDPEKAYEEENGGRGDNQKNAYVSSLERRRNRLANLSFAAFLGLSLAGTMYLGRNWDTPQEEEAHPNSPSGWGFGLFFNRISARMGDITSYYKDPAFQKLLPEEDPQFRQPYTLVLSLEDLLVHSEWSRDHGWRLAKRPGVDYFLRYLNQYYELVLFTTVPSMMADQVLRKLDPYRIIRWPLFREATRYEDGEYIKDLAYLNRDLSKVILVDTNASHAKRQPDNAVIMPKWDGDPKDKSLVSLIPFLEYIAGMGIDDVRPVIKSFEGTNIPIEFAKREKVMREKFEKQLAEERAKRPKHGVGSIASLFGIKPMGTIAGLDGSPSDGLDDGKMLWDKIRERGQIQYEMIEKEIQENGAKWLAEMAAEEEKARQEQMKGMTSSFTGFFGTGAEKK